MLDFHLREALELQQNHCQAGFRGGSSTVDQLHTVNILIQKATEYQIPCHLAFVNFTKAFDLLNQNFMLQALINHGVNYDFVKLIQEIYLGIKAKIITDVVGNSFEINKGVGQGDPVSPLLFNCALDEIFKNLNWENKGIKINREFLNNLRFTDDVTMWL